MFAKAYETVVASLITSSENLYKMAAKQEYHISRSELLGWLNNLLGLSYTKVEQCASGAAHCQIMDSLFPGKVPMSKVNFAAKQEYEFVNNYKVLQNVFTKCNVDKPIMVDRLIKAKYQDNLEFLQWMKGFHDRTSGGGEYDAQARRANAKGGATRAGSKSAPRAATKAAPAATSEAQTTQRKPLGRQAANRVPGSRQGAGKAAAAAGAKIATLTEENMELKLAVDGLERERDFYFGKLRDIEIMCQSPEEGIAMEDFVAQITKILYATEDDFVSPDELEKENEDAEVAALESEMGVAAVESY